MPTTPSPTGSRRPHQPPPAARPTRQLNRRPRRIVVKAGSALLTHGGERVNDEVVGSLVSQMAELHSGGAEVILVSSGAVAAGRAEVAVPRAGIDVPLKQVLAAVGQGLLLNRYRRAFESHEITVAQALLTRNDLQGRLGYLNVRNTLLKLLELRVVPIVNENDVVNIEQLSGRSFGDNDTLSALVANLVDADLLVMLGELGGLHTADPHVDPDARLVTRVERIDAATLAMGGESGSTDGVRRGYGGMAAKLRAARLVTASGTAAVMASGLEESVLVRLAAGEMIGTRFEATGSRLESRKRWMLSGTGSRGEVVVDRGAAAAVTDGNRSLLPAGVTGVRGGFGRGDVVTIVDPAHTPVAAGISNYDSADVSRLRGIRSDRIAEVLGHEYGEEIVHRSNLVRL